MAKPFAWSYSALTSFETCPFRHQQTRINKSIIEPQTEAILWGNKVHKALEDYVKSRTPLPESVKMYEPIVERLVKKAHDSEAKIEAEQKLALNKDLRQTRFFAKDVWVRGIVDVTLEKGNKVFVGDYKTGKRNPNSEQLMLSAAMVMQSRPWVEEVTNAFLWLKTNEVDSEKFTPDDLPSIWSMFLPRVQRMEEAIAEGNFPKRESGLCRNWCPVHSCEFNGKYDETKQ